MLLTPETAASLLRELSANVDDLLRPPAVGADQIVKVFEIELGSGARYAEIYARVLWSPGDDEDDERDHATTGDGLSVFMLEASADRIWRLVGGSSLPLPTPQAASIGAALALLEQQQAAFRPKPVVRRDRLAPKPRRPLTEHEGAGALAQTPRHGDAPRVSDAEVDGAERALGTRLPAGYRTFVTTLGEGVYGTQLRVYPPARIIGELASWRERIERYWFWGDRPLPQASALECVCIADTIGGDEIVFHPADPDALFLLPHEVERARSLGRGLATAIAKVVRARNPTFEPL